MSNTVLTDEERVNAVVDLSSFPGGYRSDLLLRSPNATKWLQDAFKAVETAVIAELAGVKVAPKYYVEGVGWAYSKNVAEELAALHKTGITEWISITDLAAVRMQERGH